MQDWSPEGRIKLYCIIRGFMNGVAETGKGVWLTWSDLSESSQNFGRYRSVTRRSWSN